MSETSFFIHESAYVDEDVSIGSDTSIWHFCHVMSGAVIGKKCKIGQNVVIHGSVLVGNNVKIQNNVSLYDGVILEDDVFCGPSCVFTNVINPRSAVPRNLDQHYRKTVVKKGASIGANVTIVCGCIIGEGSFIGAGAVVTKDVPDFALVYGNPAQVQGFMCVCGEKLKFSENKCVCASCGQKYKQENGVIKI
jgi:UDP-2-acetamido-3-amino-2,3-dideoxy-glucuronate N-acetyltransferase